MTINNITCTNYHESGGYLWVELADTDPDAAESLRSPLDVATNNLGASEHVETLDGWDYLVGAREVPGKPGCFVVTLGKEPGELPPEVIPRAAKLAELKATCQQIITGGFDVETTQGVEHFSLTTEDQINVQNLSLQVAAGAAAVLYHADGKLCRPFSPEEVTAIGAKAIEHVTVNTTLFNHLKVWVERADDDEIGGITYASQLPDDLAANMAALLGIEPGGDDA